MVYLQVGCVLLYQSALSKKATRSVVACDDLSVDVGERDRKGCKPMDPITTAIIAALSAGAASGLTETSKTAITDAYSQLKDLLAKKFGAKSEVVQAMSHLETKPESSERKETLQEEIAAVQAEQDEELLTAVKYVLTLVQPQQHFPDVDGKSARSTSPEHVWLVPYGQNPIFTGRENLLKRLHDTLTATKTSALTQLLAISGLGGIGKTQTVIEYAYRYSRNYQAILWARATTRDMLISDFVTLAGLLHLSQKNVKDQHEVIAAVKAWLVSHLNWLLILDDVDDLVMMRDFLPLHSTGHIILTTRERDVRGIASRIEMERMDEEEGALLLLRRSRLLATHEFLHQAPTVEQSQAAAIVAAVDGLPLALNQAGAYIDGAGCGLSEYLELYQTRFRELVRLPNDLFSDYRETVATTWSLSFQKVEQENEAAAALLCLCAFLAPHAIPEEIITKGAAHLGEVLGPGAADRVKLNEVMRVVQRYSLVRRNSKTKMLTVHRLVQAVFKERMNAETQQLWAMRTIQAVNAAFPEVMYETWPECQRYLLHAQACADLVEQYQLASPEAARLLTHAGWYLRERALYAQAEPLLKRALAIREHVLGAEHPDTAASYNNLAQLYRLLGEYKQAEPLYQCALAIREHVLGAKHPDTAFTLHDLGHLRYFRGEYKQAESLYQRALAIREHVLGAEHPDTATTLNHLGQLYYCQGKYKKAEVYYQHALLIREKILAPEDPLIATALNGLGLLYYAQGKYKEAETHFQHALTIRERTLGPEHHHTTITLNHLGMLYQDLGKYEQAKSLHKRVLMIRERALGSQHPDSAFALNDLAHLYHLQGRYAEAEPLYQRALAIKEQKLGSEHPGTATTYSNLARLYQEQRRYAEAEPLYKHALVIRKKKLGSEHPHTATTYNDLARLYQEQGRYAEAEPLYKHALAIKEQKLGSEHPHTATTYNDLARLYQEQGRYAEAEPLYKHALVIRKKKLGSEHPHTATTYNDLAHLYEAALVAYEQAIRLDPDNTHAYKGKADALHSLQRYDAALVAYEQAIRLDPQNMYIYKSKADALHSLGRYEEALAAYEQVICLDSGYAYAYKSKGDTLNSLGRYDEALAAYEQAIHLNSGYAYAYKSKGDTLNSLGRHDEALAAYEQARQFDYTDPAV